MLVFLNRAIPYFILYTMQENIRFKASSVAHLNLSRTQKHSFKNLCVFCRCKVYSKLTFQLVSQAKATFKTAPLNI